MKKLDHLKNIFNNYDHFIIDLWGVVHNGIKPYEGAMKTIEELYNNKKTMAGKSPKSLERFIADKIASLTDRNALEMHKKYFKSNYIL